MGELLLVPLAVSNTMTGSVTSNDAFLVRLTITILGRWYSLDQRGVNIASLQSVRYMGLLGDGGVLHDELYTHETIG